MPATHQRDFLHKLRVLLFLLSLIFDFHHDLQTEKDTSEHRTSPFHTTSAIAIVPASPLEKMKATKPLGNALDISNARKMMLHQPASLFNTH